METLCHEHCICNQVNRNVKEALNGALVQGQAEGDEEEEEEEVKQEWPSLRKDLVDH